MEKLVLREKLMQWLKKYKFVVLILFLGIVLMLIPQKQDAQETPTVYTQEQTLLSEDLERILSNVKGAGKVQVLLSVKVGEEVLYQTDGDSDKQNTVIVSGSDRSESGLIQQIIPPKYKGAIVLCQGADKPTVCLAITNAVSKVTGLDSSKISVLKMK